MSKKPTDSIVYWIRSDLRLSDNIALWEAAKSNKDLIVIYIKNFNKSFSKPGLAAESWINKSLQELSSRYKKLFNLNLQVYDGDYNSIFKSLYKETNFASLYINSTHDPEIDKIDRFVEKEFSGQFNVCSFNSSLLFNPNEILNNSGTFFKVYTPFWKNALNKLTLRDPLPIPKIKAVYKKEIKSLRQREVDFKKKDWEKKILLHFIPGEINARKMLEEVAIKIDGYSEERDFPIKNNTSQLSPYLARGELTANEIFSTIKKNKNKMNINDYSKFTAQLGWREFSYNILFNFPKLPKKNFISKFDNFPWQKNNLNLVKWQKGLTGYPIVDAGMRELWATGYMHNRLRMITASFLIKNLNMSWTEGANWFWNNLFDADIANNSAGWQWVAGCGTDAAPYFRIFNPTLQSIRFDKGGKYIRKWVPELKELPDKFIHAPWELTEIELVSYKLQLGKDYPYPIVDHKKTRDEALKNYKKINISK